MEDAVKQTITLRKAAIIAGIAIFLMVLCAPFAEVYVYPKLVVHGNASATTHNILAHKGLFVGAVYAYLVTNLCDIIAAWALYILLRPVNKYLSLLTAFFRLSYAFIALMALMNLTTVYRLLTDANYSAVFTPVQLQAQVMLLLNTFRYNFHFGLVIFGLHMVMLGYLIWRAGYIPKIMGVFVALSGLGYLATSSQPYLWPDANINFAVYTFYGELIFMLWLLIWGWKIKDQTLET